MGNSHKALVRILIVLCVFGLFVVSMLFAIPIKIMDQLVSYSLNQKFSGVSIESTEYLLAIKYPDSEGYLVNRVEDNVINYYKNLNGNSENNVKFMLIPPGTNMTLLKIMRRTSTRWGGGDGITFFFKVHCFPEDSYLSQVHYSSQRGFKECIQSNTLDSCILSNTYPSYSLNPSKPSVRLIPEFSTENSNCN